MPLHTVYCPICRKAVDSFVVPKDCSPRIHALRACSDCYASRSERKQADLERVAARRRAELAPLPQQQVLLEQHERKALARARAARKAVARG